MSRGAGPSTPLTTIASSRQASGRIGWEIARCPWCARNDAARCVVVPGFGAAFSRSSSFASWSPDTLSAARCGLRRCEHRIEVRVEVEGA